MSVGMVPVPPEKLIGPHKSNVSLCMNENKDVLTDIVINLEVFAYTYTFLSLHILSQTDWPEYEVKYAVL